MIFWLVWKLEILFIELYYLGGFWFLFRRGTYFFWRAPLLGHNLM
jgi:hypothetical protein